MTNPVVRMVMPSPTPSPSGTAEAATHAAGRTGADQPLAGADGLKNAVTSHGGFLSDLVDTLDRLAVQVGSSRISVWDLVVLLFVLGLVISIAWGASRLSSRVLRSATGLDQTQRLLAEKLVSLLIWTIAILVGIDVLGIDLTALTVFSGAFGLAIGFGLQKTFGNLIAGIILLMDKSIKPGDVITITDAAGMSTFGQIRRIGIRAVSLTTRDQKEYLIPNENLMINQVENWSYSSKNVRIQVPVVMPYACDIERVEHLMLDAAKSVRRVLAAPPPTVWLDSFAERGVSFVIHVWITDPEEGVGNVRSDVLKALWRLMREQGIEVPYPQRDLNVRDTETMRQVIEALRGTHQTRSPTDPSVST
ncbi:mechanosensitive ion channel-like protein [Novosphingobium sp. PhB57]|jgi:small-conductance mechanosensitive channel|uniref:mechanosensitive ion channel family protein n=1 Tax=Novosphingobium sp. PhB57 TaxID=2485107 RepID=UPI00104BDE81|nr:mechanosensitive ion channel domain-containing protein [Novosphingobium sp. PhB57]TCU52347.1 mechanosensitive ion channel-like protein [Novosphingobium sp. PhB57]